MGTIKEILDQGAAALNGVSNTARLDCEVLLGHLLQLSKAALISESKLPLTKFQQELFLKLIERRKNFEPVAYLTGKKEFYGLEITVTPEVLIPRPETELLVDLALERLKSMKDKLKILDLGTGSGCISIALASEIVKLGREVQINAVDIREESLKVAWGNIEKFNLAKIIRLIQSNWFDNLDAGCTYDLIVSNPPYVAEGDAQMSPETKYEPSQALFSGPQGLDAIRHIISQTPEYINPGGVLLIEIGSNQGLSFPNSLIHKDISGKDRILEFLPLNFIR